MDRLSSRGDDGTVPCGDSASRGDYAGTATYKESHQGWCLRLSRVDRSGVRGGDRCSLDRGKAGQIMVGRRGNPCHLDSQRRSQRPRRATPDGIFQVGSTRPLRWSPTTKTRCAERSRTISETNAPTDQPSTVSRALYGACSKKKRSAAKMRHEKLMNTIEKVIRVKAEE